MYSGMLPAVVAGLCPEQSAQVHLPSLCKAYSWHFVHASITRVDPSTNTVFFRPASAALTELECPLRFDALSINIGSSTRNIGVSALQIKHQQPTDGNERHVEAKYKTHGRSPTIIRTRPIAKLVSQISTFERDYILSSRKQNESGNSSSTGDSTKVLVIGAGAAGLELALALHTRFSRSLSSLDLTLISRASTFASQHGRLPANAVTAELNDRRINHLIGSTVTLLDESTGMVHLDDSTQLPFDLAVLATGASPHDCIADLGLQLDEDGWLLVEPTLLCVGHANIFAVGDCASFGNRYGSRFPPKAGVFAVRQGPFITRNLQIVLGLGGVEPKSLHVYVPQSSYLSLLSTGDGRGIGSKYGLVFKGTWVFRLKMHIDEAWQKRFQVTKSTTEQENEMDPKSDEDSSFEGDAIQGAAILFGAEDIDSGDSFETQLNILRKMDRDEDFREALIQQVAHR